MRQGAGMAGGGEDEVARTGPGTAAHRFAAAARCSLLLAAAAKSSTHVD